MHTLITDYNPYFGNYHRLIKILHVIKFINTDLKSIPTFDSARKEVSKYFLCQTKPAI